MSFDKVERKKSTKILLSLVILLSVILIALSLIIPDISNALNEFNNGVGFKDAAIYAFFTTMVLLVILAIASGDGLLGELQFLLSTFFILFFIIWLFIAWIF